MIIISCRFCHIAFQVTYFLETFFQHILLMFQNRIYTEDHQKHSYLPLLLWHLDTDKSWKCLEHQKAVQIHGDVHTETDEEIGMSRWSMVEWYRPINPRSFLWQWMAYVQLSTRACYRGKRVRSPGVGQERFLKLVSPEADPKEAVWEQVVYFKGETRKF